MFSTLVLAFQLWQALHTIAWSTLYNTSQFSFFLHFLSLLFFTSIFHSLSYPVVPLASPFVLSHSFCFLLFFFFHKRHFAFSFLSKPQPQSIRKFDFVVMFLSFSRLRTDSSKIFWKLHPISDVSLYSPFHREKWSFLFRYRHSEKSDECSRKSMPFHSLFPLKQRCFHWKVIWYYKELFFASWVNTGGVYK